MLEDVKEFEKLWHARYKINNVGITFFAYLSSSGVANQEDWFNSDPDPPLTLILTSSGLHKHFCGGNFFGAFLWSKGTKMVMCALWW